MSYFYKMKFLPIILLTVACSTVPAQQITEIDNSTLVEKMKDSDFQLVDVRTPAEIAQGYIQGAERIDFLADGFEAKIQALDKSKPIAVVCKSGGRSARAALKLKELGFKQIFDVSGGMSSWQAENRPMVKN